MGSDTPLAISRLLRAPRALVYQAFTDPDHLLAWWGPVGNSLLREEMDFDVRPGGYQRWTEIRPAQPDLRVRVEFSLTAVKDCELLDGVMRVDRHLKGSRLESFTSRLRVEFYEDGATRTRLEIRRLQLRSAGSGTVPDIHQPHVVHANLPVREKLVHRDGTVGDRSCVGPAVRTHCGVRRGLAGRSQDRVLLDAARALHRAHPNRA